MFPVTAATQAPPTGIMAHLQVIVTLLENSLENHNQQIKASDRDGEGDWKQDMHSALRELVQLLQEECTISTSELISSGLVQALCNCLNESTLSSKENRSKAIERINLFKQDFQDTMDGAVAPAVTLVRKLMAVLESIEKLPVFSYDDPAYSNKLEVLSRQLHMKLERKSGATSLIDQSGITLEMEPLTTVDAVERHLLKLVGPAVKDDDNVISDVRAPAKEKTIPTDDVDCQKIPVLDNDEEEVVNSEDRAHNLDSEEEEEEEENEYDFEYSSDDDFGEEEFEEDPVTAAQPQKEFPTAAMKPTRAPYRDFIPAFEDENSSSSEEEVEDVDTGDVDEGRTWDDVRKQFSALLSPYNNTTYDFEIASPDSTFQTPPTATTPAQRRLQLFITAPANGGGSPVMVPMTDPQATVFSYVQQLRAKMAATLPVADTHEFTKCIWEPTYRIVYEELKEEEAAAVAGSSSDVQVRRCMLLSDMEAPLSTENNACLTKDVLHLLQLLYAMSHGEQTSVKNSILGSGQLNIPDDEFISKKLTEKLKKQIKDPLVLASNACPEWCERLTRCCPMLFPLEARKLFLNATAFGPSRAIMWLQDNVLLEDNYDIDEFAQLKQEFVTIPRDHRLLDWAMQIMQFHADRKPILEVGFPDEGIGPDMTREFFLLLAAELQCKKLGLWLCDDMARQVDVERGEKPPGYYVQRSCGLFPCPMPQNHPRLERVERLFELMGTFFAKCMQGREFVNMPLSRPFLKLICGGDVQDMAANYRELHKKQCSSASTVADSTAWYVGLLSQNDFKEVDPVRARFLQKLTDLSARKMALMADEELSAEERHNRLQELTLDDSGAKVDDLCIKFVYNPPSTVYGFGSIELKPGGENINVSLDNIEEYVDLMTDLCLRTGIQRQMNAFRSGFDKVFQMDNLFAFSSIELQTMLCGEQKPQWTRDDLINHIITYDNMRESVGFERYMNVLMNMDNAERKAFLQFVTGCSSLPPGGLANLQPKITIFRRFNMNDGMYPKAQTCLHYLQLPDYSSEAILRQRLLAAIKYKEKAYLEEASELLLPTLWA